MNWVNLRVSTLRSPAYIGCEPVARATWLNVLTLCIEQENGGRIEGARAWKDRQWQQTCGVMLSEVESAAPLLSWDGDALVVWEYPLDKQKEVIEKREVAKTNGKLGGRPKNQLHNPEETNEEPTSVSEITVVGNQRPKAEGEGERNRKEKGIGNGTTTHPPSDTAGMVEGNGKKLLPTTDQSKRIAAIFHRKLTTGWSDDEYKAYRKIGTVAPEDLESVETYYGELWPPTHGSNILRHDLQTFLNNFTGEVDRARNYVTESANRRNQLFTS